MFNQGNWIPMRRFDLGQWQHQRGPQSFGFWLARGNPDLRDGIEPYDFLSSFMH